MKALIDADVLLHECSAVAEQKDATESTEARTLKSFDFVKELFDGRIRDILKATEASDYILYVTGGGNFREEVAVTRPYKGNRKEEKPFHYDNLKAYIKSLPNTTFVEGMEADDAMSIEQYRDYVVACADGDSPAKCGTVICTRDKDLRMVPGWHYGWECGYQAEFKKQFIEELGELSLSSDRKKLKGSGLKFFWSQMLTGDRVDNIPGLIGSGPVDAYNLLNDLHTEEQMFTVVRQAYQAAHPDTWEEYMLEQGRLLWMVRETDQDGYPVMWRVPEYDREAVQ